MSNTSTIAKNTFFLYIRMLLSMVVSLYTSRVVLEILGVEDFGIYTLIGGIVALLNFFNSAMASATQRFLTFDIGNNNLVQLKKTFSASVNIHILIALVSLIMAETIGNWFLNNKLNFNEDKMSSVNWVYQFSVLTFVVGILKVPYEALIVSNEKMSAYAYMGIFEVSVKLVMIYLLTVFDVDKLILYAFLLFIVSIFSGIVHNIYCKVSFKEIRHEFQYDKKLYAKLISFSGWSLFGNIAGAARGQGINVLLNVFFGTLINAAYGITMQVQAAVQVFVYNFQLAISPQIIKEYAIGNREKSLNLIFKSSKYSYFLMLVISSPIIYNVDFVLEIWLKNPPVYTSSFVNLTLVSVLIDSISGPLVTGAQANGQIKWYQISVGILIFMSLPISYFVISESNNPVLVFVVVILINILALFCRLLLLKYLIEIDLKLFLSKVLLKISLVTLFVLLMGKVFVMKLENSGINFLAESIYISIVNLVTIYFFGVSNDEKIYIRDFLKRKAK